MWCRTKQRITYALVFLTALAIALSSTLSDARAKEKLLRLVCPAPEGDWPLTYKDKRFAERFNERAKGEYRIEVYPGGALAKLPEYMDAIRAGAVEIVDGPPGLFAFLDSRFGLLEMPFLFDSMQGATAACERIEQLYKPVFEKFNANLLAFMNAGGIQLVSTRPVRVLEDWRGVLIGAISPPTAEMIKALGASPTVISWVDAYQALQKKVIDATVQSTHGAIQTGLHDICKHFIIFYGMPGWNAFWMNKQVWDEMPPHIRDILLDEAKKAAYFMSEVTMTAIGDMDMMVLRQKGVNIYIVPKEERERWKKACELYVNEQIKKHGDFGRDFYAIVQEINRKYPYNERGLY